MAFSQEGLLGEFRGRLGNLVIYKMNGKIVMRTRPSRQQGPARGRQKETQESFARVMAILQPLKSWLKMGFNDLAGGKYVFHKALSENLKRFNAAADPGELDWLQLSMGDRAGAQNLQVQLPEGAAQLSWGEPEPGKPYDDQDRVMLLALNTNTLQFTDSARAGQRSDGQASIALPPTEEGEKIMVFITFFDLAGAIIKKDLKNISNSQIVVVEGIQLA